MCMFRYFLHEFINTSLQLYENVWKIILRMICRSILQVHVASIMNLFFEPVYAYKREERKLPNQKTSQILKF